MSVILKRHKLSDIAKIIRGVTYGSDDGQDNPLETHLPVLRAGNIQDRLLLEKSLVWVPSSKISREQQIKQHDIIMCTSSGSATVVGKCARAEFDWQGSFGAFCAAIRPEQKKCDPSYLNHYLRSPAFTNWSSLSAGANIKNIRKSELEDFEIPLPPLPEQKRIAAILDKADSIRRKRQEAVRLTEELLRSVFLDMFGDPVTNPKGWDVVEFGELCEELRYGTSNMCSTDRKDGDLPVLRIPNVIGGLVNWDNMKYVQLPDAENKRLRLVQGDILFVRTNGNPEYIGRCAVYENTRSALYASYLIRARLKKDSPCLSQYASSCFTFPTYRKMLIVEAKTTAGNFNINTQGLKSLKLPVPPLNLQKKFVTLRTELAKSIVLLQSGVGFSDTLFSSLLLRAFNGKL
jgi:type I restriction enzyme, S subunit